MGFFDRFFNKDKKEDLEKGLEKTKVGFFEKISKAIAGKSTIDEGVLDELEQVNGVGKTTTIGKLAYQYTQAGHKVMIAAGDTFRAAAENQLHIWSDRVGCQFFTKGMGADPSAVAYEATAQAVKDKIDVLIVDTAGRLHTKTNLMNELSKIQRSIDKAYEGTPHDVLLILDATTGQNAIEQCRQFTATTHVTGLVLTKLDGTAKGGVAIGISDQFKIPIKYIGVGEAIDKLQVFNRRAFIDSLFQKSKTEL